MACLNESQIQFILDNEPMYVQEIVDLFDIKFKTRSVESVLRRKGLPYKKKLKLMDEEKLQWLRDNAHLYNQDEILKMRPDMPCNNRNFATSIKNTYGILVKPFTKEELRDRSNSKYTLDLDLFGNGVVTADEHYLLGMFLGDGYLAKDGPIWVMKDLDVLQVLQRIFKTDTPITDFYHKPTGNTYKKLQINSSIIRDNIKALDLFENKSYDCKYPKQLVQEHEHHFLRGLLDADGCITYSDKNNRYRLTVGYVGAYDLLYGVSAHSESTAKVNATKHNAFTYVISGNYACDFIRKLYDNPYNETGDKLYMERKYIKAINGMAMWKNRNTSKKYGGRK